MAFNVGDRVRVNEEGYENVRGKVGTVKDLNRHDIAVEFDEYNRSLHNCDGYCENGRGYFLTEHMLELVDTSENNEENNTKSDEDKKELVEMTEKELRELKVKINEVLTSECSTTKNIDKLKRELEDAEGYVKDYQDRLTKAIRKRNALSKEIAYFKSEVIDFYTKIQEISRSSKIKSVDVDLDNKCITAFTECLYMYTSNGARYLAGEYKVEYYPKNNDVRYYAMQDSMKRKSYWSDKDPHPHVNGKTGSACLGNSAESIAYLGGELEFQALFDILIAFLEQANIDDCAGRHVMNWDKVDNNGEIIREGYQNKYYTEFSYDKTNHENDKLNENTRYCAHCDESSDEDNMFYIDGEWVCEDCRDEHYFCCDDCDEWHHIHERTIVANGDGICESCLDEYRWCEKCEEWYIVDDCDHIDGEYYCETCRDEKFFYCEACEKYFLKSEYSMYTSSCGEELCESCYEEQRDEDEVVF